MQPNTYKFSYASSRYYLGGNFSWLKKICDIRSAILITDENVFGAHHAIFKGWNTIVLKAGEAYKIQATVDAVIEQLIAMEADRSTIIVGVGGGVITDLAGYVASVYMRGLRFGFVPTSLLAMVDASIGGKNGIDVGIYKNMVGVTRQPSFILQDTNLLASLPETEWMNGFAEIIKHACIKDAAMFRQLKKGSLKIYLENKKALEALVRRNIILKTKTVQRDEFEKGERRLLNFGHTLGHALENQYELSHGQAIAIGMTYACHVSEKITGFRQTNKVVQLLEQYGLPTYAAFNAQKVFAALKMDKKREKKEIRYIMLEKIGKAVIQSISLKRAEKFITNIKESR